MDSITEMRRPPTRPDGRPFPMCSVTVPFGGVDALAEVLLDADRAARGHFGPGVEFRRIGYAYRGNGIDLTAWFAEVVR